MTMQQICVRCTRLSRKSTCQSIRRFSASATSRDDPAGSSTGSSTDSGPAPRRTRKPIDLSTSSSESTAPVERSVRPAVEQQRFTITRTSSPSQGGRLLTRPANATARTSPQPGGQILTRKAPSASWTARQSASSPFQGQNQQRTPGRGPAVPPSVLIRRTLDRQRQGQGGEAGQSGRPGGSRAPRGAPTDRRRRRAAQPDTLGSLDMTTDEASEILDTPHTPTEAIPYNPKDITIEDLRTDWPNTPMSPVGVVESVQQRIEFLARRIPHGYLTPEELAEHYQKGNLTRFESEKEREKVLELAQGLAAKRADMLTERKSEVVPADDMSFADLSNSAEKTSLAAKMVQGVYPELEKQRMPFLDNIAKALRNNETYHEVETEQFLKRIENLLPPPGGRGAQQQSRKRA